MNEQNETFVSLRILGFPGSPARISELLSETPSETFVIGDLRVPTAIVKHATNGWCWESSGAPTVEMMCQIKEVVDCFLPKAHLFKFLPKDTEVLLSCVLYLRGTSPQITIDPRTIQFLHEINAKIDIDIM
jgi:hypothetical protein